MTYAGDKRILDADSHIMELPDFLSAHAEQAMRGRLPSLDDVGLAVEGIRMSEYRGARGHPPDVVEKLAAKGAEIIKGPKWHDALGAFSGSERGAALDLLGFERQVVFSSFCARPIFGHPDLAVRIAAARAHNRAMAEFCSADSRLIGVAMTVLDDVGAALETVDEAQKLGLGAMWIPADAPGGRSPGHPDHDTLWARLAELQMPFILHVGSAPLNIDDGWMNDGRPAGESARGRAEVIGSKDLMVIHQPIQRFLSILILDGVLERFPALKGAAVEMGAGWVPDMIRRLDHGAQIWAKSEPHLAEMTRRPSEQIRDQLRFTPYPFEDVGELIRESAPELYLFSSDYPHAEGGRDPIGRFDRALSDADATTKQLFYAGNFEALYPAP